MCFFESGSEWCFVSEIAHAESIINEALAHLYAFEVPSAVGKGSSAVKLDSNVHWNKTNRVDY